MAKGRRHGRRGNAALLSERECQVRDLAVSLSHFGRMQGLAVDDPAVVAAAQAQCPGLLVSEVAVSEAAALLVEGEGRRELLELACEASGIGHLDRLSEAVLYVALQDLLTDMGRASQVIVDDAVARAQRLGAGVSEAVLRRVLSQLSGFRTEIRRTLRGWALALLYGQEFGCSVAELSTRFLPLLSGHEESAPPLFLNAYTAEGAVDPRARLTLMRAQRLAQEVLARREELDERVQASSARWRLRRMALIDLNILRLAAYELLVTPQTPPKIVINEAVELAKLFGAEQSRSFVNGILQQLCTDNGIAII